MASSCWGTLFASHIIGGDVSYNFIRYNADSSFATYSVEFIIYRDTAGLDFDVLGDFGIFRRTSDLPWSSYDVISGIPIGPVERISALDDPCKDEILSDLIIESAIYNFEITLEVGAFHYMIAYQRCCRNYTISNILDPGETGAVYDIIITPESQKVINSSPVFKKIPPVFVCLGFDFDFDHSARDLEGDELVYSFCTPFISGTNPGSAPPICCDCVKPDPETCLPEFDHVTYVGIYNEDNPVGGDPQIVIDPVTGRISGSPNIMGSFVVGVCVEELRDGTVIGNYRRDFEFNVEICTPRIDALLLSDSLIIDTSIHRSEKVHSFTTCEGDLAITNLSTDLALIYDYKWMIYDENETLIILKQGQFEKDVLLNLPGNGRYVGHMVLNDLDKCVDTAFFKIDVLPSIDLSFESSFDPCEKGPISLLNTSSYGLDEDLNWEWIVNDNSVGEDLDHIISEPQLKDYLIELRVTDENKCSASIQRSISYDYYDAPPEVQISKQTICSGDVTSFYGQSLTDAGRYEELILSLEDGCDSVLYILELEHYPQPELHRFDSIICNGASIDFNNQQLSESGLYRYSEQFENGICDSVIYELNLKISQYPVLIRNDTSLCVQDSILFENTWIKNSGTFERIIKSTTTGCDSFMYILDVAFLEEVDIQFKDTSICSGDSVFFENNWIFQSGEYEEFFYSVNGCDSLENNLSLIVHDPFEIWVSTPDSILPYLDYQISVETNASFPSIDWSPAEGLSCTDCLNPRVNIKEDITFEILITDTNGCSKSEMISFLVDPIVDFYLPNVVTNFAPINGVNQFFFLQCNPDFSFQYNMTIYDRWGSEVGKFDQLSTNSADDGWYARDHLPGVYVYYIEILADIQPNVLAGDFTVIK